MKQQIENIIKKNLPIIKEEYLDGKIITHSKEDTLLVQAEILKGQGFNQALSQINTSLIADEVLKVVVEKINEIEKSYLGSGEFLSEIGNGAKCVIEDIKSALSNLSPNKENKNNEHK